MPERYLLRRLSLALLILWATAAGTSTPAGAQAVTEFPIPTANSLPLAIAAGPDGNLWFTENTRNKIGRITTAGVITEFTLPTANSSPYGITAGPDGNLWFTEQFGNRIGQITPAGVITEFPLPTADGQPAFITAGPDGNLWFTESGASKVGRITIAGTITEFPLPTVGSGPFGIIAGADGNLWFAESNRNKIGRITTAGVITEFTVPTADSFPIGITAGPDENLWFAEFFANKIGRITTAGVITEFTVPTTISEPSNITAGPDGNLWFVEEGGNKIGQITTAGVITEFPLPRRNVDPVGITAGPDGNLWFTEASGIAIGRLVLPPPANLVLAAVLPLSRSVQVGNFATAFASILNISGATATGCGIAPVSSVPGNFIFQTTDPTSNALTGTANTRVSIPDGMVQSFVVAFQANAPYVSTNVQLGFACSGLPAAASIVSLDTLLLTFDQNPVADMIAVGVTESNDGFAHIPGVGGTGVFAIAASNIGVARQLTARARTLDPSTSATTLVCETNPQNGLCKASPAPTVTRTINSNEDTTWTVFITSTAAIPADPAKHRVLFQFDEPGAIRGLTTTAVTTQ